MADADNLTFYLLASVILAVLLAAVLAVHFGAQREAGIDEQAQALADDISRLCFAALARQQPTYSLPSDVGGCGYELGVEDNAIVVTVLEGPRAGSSYRSIVNAELTLDNGDFEPGGKVYVRRLGDVVLISASPIFVILEELEPPSEPTPPPFYSWANENVGGRREEAVAVVAAYFYALERYSSSKDDKVLDVLAYKREGDIVDVRMGYRGAEEVEFLLRVRATGGHDASQVGEVTGAWIVDNVENLRGDITDVIDCPSVEDAARTGWLYSPSQVLAHLRGRTWRLGDNTIVVVPEYASWRAAAASVDGRTFCTHRFSFTHENIPIVLFFRMLATAPEEPQPGFTFTSEPKLEPIT
ncbi:MAG: hypothetical protein AVW06_05150 [Hadesarchaea archaeon DG-33-1]|nr:MAG: hypothetical protein AVW06_05150 [Hadesarchaea archaeon DG-33-1]